jgi:hypothetical protein
MKFRLSTLCLLIVVAALAVGFALQSIEIANLRAMIQQEQANTAAWRDAYILLPDAKRVRASPRADRLESSSRRP